MWDSIEKQLKLAISPIDLKRRKDLFVVASFDLQVWRDVRRDAG